MVGRTGACEIGGEYWHVGPKQDFNLGPKQQYSLLEFEISTS